MTITYVLDGSLYVNVTNRCPNGCTFCVRELHDSVGDADSLWLEHEPSRQEIFDDIMRRTLCDYPELVFCGFGEPFCRLEDVLWVAQEVKKKSSIPIRVNTNGLGDLLAGQDVAPRLVGCIDVLSISLNAPTPERYQEICQSEYGLQALPAIIRFARRAKRAGLDVRFTVVDTLPADEIDQCRKISQEAGIPLRVRHIIA